VDLDGEGVEEAPYPFDRQEVFQLGLALSLACTTGPSTPGFPLRR
jgi:hypothetical protein